MEMNSDIDGVILAAGFSSRTGTFKMELQLGDKTLIQRTIESMIDSCARVIVVAGYQNERILRLTKGYDNVEVILNPHYSKGMFTSIKQGVKHVKAAWFFLTPGDYPLVTKTIYQKLLQARNTFPGENIFIPVFNGRKGHPILVKNDLSKEIIEEPDQSNLREVIKRKGFVPVEVEDDSILLDIDTMEDYQKAKERFSPQRAQRTQRKKGRNEDE